MVTSLKTEASNQRNTTALKGQPNGAEQNVQELKVAYIMSRFPKLTETFVLYEMLAVERKGVQIELYPLLREKTDVMHPEAVDYVERANYQPFISWPIIRSNLRSLWQRPFAYLGTLGTIIRANWGSWRYLSGAFGIFPKSVHFAHLMAKDGVEHIHAHFASHPAAAAFIVHRMSGIPYSFTGHGSDLNRDQHMLCEKVAEASFVVPVSNFFREMILNLCGEQYADKVIVIHCGVDTDTFQPVERNERESENHEFNIFCVGTLHEVKGQTYLVEACRLLNERGIDFNCHFIGDGPDISDLVEQVEQAGLSDRVRFHGRRTHEEVAALLQDATVLVTPSVPTNDGRREGIPVVLMEAMASGLPVVSTAISGIPELVEDQRSGYLTEPGDSVAIADALAALYFDPALRQQFAQAGREKVEDEFDLEKNAAILASNFNKRR
ncbi:MAG: glycosyltransferase [Candidatus Promineifilaceae bacterium]|nr:glycosyltransferase [Candidatus Promineifilaceae bacterium]